jgi:hypothetical protein
MDSPINNMIDRASNRKAASSMKAKAKRTKALNDQVLSLVADANATALPERHVTPRAALIVMARAMKELSSLSDESRTHGVLREVSKFISLNQKTLLASASIKHVDLLPKGHPLSPLNASLTEDDLRKKYAAWIAADPAISDEARPLVAMAHSLPPESIEREHAFLRLRSLQASAVPAYFKIDDVTALVAAFMNGNSSAARRARVALQWRDRMGRWIEMGRGINFRFRLPDGSVVTGRGNYVGAGSNPRVERTSTGTSLVSDTGLIEVSGVPGLQPGLYAIDSKNAAAYQARIPGFEAPQQVSFEDQFDADIPSASDLQGIRRELPIGWKKQGPYYVSDDNYAVIPGRNGQPEMVTRLSADGRPAGSIGNARDWSEVNALIEKDQPSFDKEIARIEAEGEEGQLPLARIPGATEEDVVSFDDIANMQKQRAEENKKFDESRPAAKPLGDKDLHGNVVPKSWKRQIGDDTRYSRRLPLRDGGTYPVLAVLNDDGTYTAGHSGGWIPEPGTDGRGPSRKFTSWREIESEGLPGLIEYLNEGFTKDNPIDLSQDTTETPNLSPDFLRTLLQGVMENDLSGQRFSRSMMTKEEREFFDSLETNKDGRATTINEREDIVRDMMDKLGVEPAEFDAGFFDKDGNRISEAPGEKLTPEQIKKASDDISKNIKKNTPARRFPTEPTPEKDKAGFFDKDGNRMRDENGISVPANSTTVAAEQNGDAVIVRMPDGTLVQYDTEGPEGIPYTEEQKQKLINDVKSGETIWFDEEGRTNWKALLEGDTGFNYDSAKAIALDSSKSAQERYAAIFDGAKGTNLPRYVEKFGTKRSELDPSIPNGAMVVFADGDGQNLTLRYPDGTYHYLDTGATDENDLISADPVSAYDAGGVNDKVLKDLLDPESLMYARGGFIDDARQAAITEGSSGDGDVNSKEIYERRMAGESLQEVADSLGLTREQVRRIESEYARNNPAAPQGMKLDFADPEKAAEDAGLPEDAPFNDIVKAWFDQNIKPVAPTAKLDGFEEGGPDGPNVSISAGNEEDLLNAFRVYFGDDEATLEDLRDNSEEYSAPGAPVERYIVDFETLGSSDMFEDIPGLEDEDPTEMTEEEALQKWLEAKGLDKLGVKVVGASEDGLTKRVTFDIPVSAKDAFGKAYGLDLDENIGDGVDKIGGGSDEPPSPGGGTPPKVPSPSTPGSPGLFEDFDKPAGAYQLRTTEYEPEGRIDEASTDFTDDPRRLATKFSLDDLVTAFTEALIGRPDEAAMQDILNANVDDNDDLPDLADLADVAESNAPRATANNASGAGALEFNAGEEYVLAEALYNAVYEAGGDPNRVIANAYDAVNGNRNNVQKLLDAQGGVSSPEEIQLIEDITDEIRQIKDVTPDDEIDAVNKRTTPEKKFAGSLIENVPVDYNNPDYFDMDTDAYIPAQPETDENGYTDNPEVLALDYESADLIEQMLEGITDGSGVALLDFGGEDGVHEVPVEALRDAIQLQDINTNEILFKLRDESNDMSEEPTTEPEAPRLAREDIRWDEQKGLYTDVNGKILDGDTVDAAGLDSSLRDGRDADIQLLRPAAEQPQEEAPTQAPSSTRAFTPFLDAFEEDSETSDMLSDLAELDKAANAAVNFFSTGLSGARFIGFNPEKGSIAIITPENRGEGPRAVIANADGQVTNMATMTPADAIQFMSDVGPMFGWQPIPQRVADSIISENILLFPESNQPSVDATPEAPATEATAPTPAFAYPGPREAGYTANNTTLASDGSIIGAGSIVVANRDGKRGVVLSIQNDPEYARIRFEDGKVAVRSANQIKAVSNPDGTLAMLPSGAAAPSGATPSTDVESRLEAPVRQAPNIARSGAAWGVNDTTDIPDYIKPLVRENVSQSDFAAWGSRDAEIMNAATNRASLDSLLALVDKYETARANGEDAAVLRAIKDETGKALIDVYGGRDGVSFGVDGFAVNVVSSSSSVNSRAQADGRTAKSYSLRVGFYLKDKNGREVGEGSRTITIEDSTDENGNAVRNSYVKNDILKVYGANKKKGFASAYNRYMENWYIANGIDKVKVMAAGGGGSWQGAFVWALNGFDWENADAARGMIRSLGFAAKTPEEKAIAKKLADKADAASGDVTKVPTPLEVALAGWYPGAKKWFGKDVIIERSWNGVKHLNPTAREQIQSINYGQIKNAERRIQAGQNKPGLSAVGLAHVMDNSFQTGNPELGPYIEQIRDVLRNNRSLASLSPAAKSVLNAFTSKEMLNKDSSMPIEDIFRLRTALMSEYRAENDYANPFGALERALSEVKMQTSRSTTTLDMSALRAAGFKAQALTGDDSGVNDTFRVVHEPSGQVFFIKKEQLSRSWNSARGLTSEVEANTIMNALEMLGIQSVRGSSKDSDVIVMSQAGASLPLAAPAENASKMMTRGIKDANGNVFVGGDSGKFLDVLKNPEDIINMAIVDMLGAGQDRHDSNWMAAFDSTDNRMVMFPIDNALLTVDKTESGIEDFFISTWPDTGEVYNQVMPRFIKNAGEDRAAEIFMNQVRKLVKNLDNPLFQPKGEELAALIDKWGSYDAFKDALKTRLTTIVTPGSAENKALINSMKMSYWR